MSVPRDSEIQLKPFNCPLARSQLCGPAFAWLMETRLWRGPAPSCVLMTLALPHTPVDSSWHLIEWAVPFQLVAVAGRARGSAEHPHAASPEPGVGPSCLLSWVHESGNVTACSQKHSPTGPATRGQLYTEDQTEPALCFLQRRKMLFWLRTKDSLETAFPQFHIHRTSNTVSFGETEPNSRAESLCLPAPHGTLSSGLSFTKEMIFSQFHSKTWVCGKFIKMQGKKENFKTSLILLLRVTTISGILSWLLSMNIYTFLKQKCAYTLSVILQPAFFHLLT